MTRSNYLSFSAFIAIAIAISVLNSTAHAQTVTYSNVGTFTNTGFVNGGATAATANTTRLVADDINPITIGAAVTGFKFNVTNFDSATFTARPRVRFYAADGTGGAPGTYITGFSFNPISFTGLSSVTFDTGVLAAASQFTLPTSNNGRFWAGMTFDNLGATATLAQLNNLGQGIFEPPTIGSSDNSLFFVTTAGGSFVGNNPIGTLSTITGAASNFGWEFTTTGGTPVVVPEANTVALLGAGLAPLAGIVVARRRRKIA